MITKTIAILLLALVLAPSEAVAQGVGSLRLSPLRLLAQPRPPLSDSVSRILTPDPAHLVPDRRRTAAMTECTMPVVVPNLAASAPMPGAHAPAPQSVGTERFGCTNPRGPRPARTLP